MKTIILFILFLLLLVSYLFYVNHRKKSKDESQPAVQEALTRPSSKDDGECCGQHEVCERDLLISSKIKADYYDDEELDQFVGREADSYTDEERKMFEDVFYTMKEYDVSGWLRSLQLRGITPPENVKEEALFIVQERRFKK